MSLSLCAIIVSVTFLSPSQAQVCWEGGEYLLNIAPGATNPVPFRYVVEQNGVALSVQSPTGTWQRFINPNPGNEPDGDTYGTRPTPDNGYQYDESWY